jgi:hypothetical protein
MMANTRRLNFGAVALVKGRVRNDISTMTAVRNELESVLNKSGWFPSAPFKSIGLIIRYGTKTNLKPAFEGIHKSSAELQVAVELNMDELRLVHRDSRKLEGIARGAITMALLGVADEYQLSKQAIETYISQRADA